MAAVVRTLLVLELRQILPRPLKPALYKVEINHATD